MNDSKLKGNLLEYIIRKILLNCGFTSVLPDGLFIYYERGLKFITGKGSSHDADVLMNPPIQMPFSYPFRLLFECKAYKDKLPLTYVRNALGLRYDINEFEIVTRGQIMNRRNNRRRNLAIDNRPRYVYQVGVASLNGFTKTAIEFSANNKIPLISLKQLLPDVIEYFSGITDNLVETYEEEIKNVTDFLKGNNNLEGETFLENSENAISQVYKKFREFEDTITIGLLESGDLIFLSTNSRENIEFLKNARGHLSAQFHYHIEERERWILSIQNHTKDINFYFDLPTRIVALWLKQDFDNNVGVDFKRNLFHRIFIFINDRDIPFRIINIDQEWLEENLI